MNIIVGMSDMRTSANPEDVLITYSLGSCIGICAYDPIGKIGGILHFMLPESALDRTRARNNPYMFADTGIPALLTVVSGLGAKPRRLKIVVAGGAQILAPEGLFRIGRQNYAATKRLFEAHRIVSDFEDVGGVINRTMTLKIKTGSVLIRAPGRQDRQV